MIIAGQFMVPYLPLISPQPIISGYIGYYAGVMALCLIPMILIARAGFGLIWNHRFDPQMRRILLGAWMVSFIVFAATVAFGARNFAFKEGITSSVYNGPINPDQPLVIEVDELDSQAFDDRIQLNFGHSMLDNGKLYVTHGVDLRVLPSDDPNLTVSSIDKSWGNSPRNAKKNLSLFQNEVSVQENIINIDEYYVIPLRSKFRAQQRTIEIHIPIGQDIVLKGSLDAFSRRDFNDASPRKVKTWTMTSDGLIEKI